MNGRPRFENRDPQIDEPPPFLGTWSRVYVAVIGWLVTLILLFYIFARSFPS